MKRLLVILTLLFSVISYSQKPDECYTESLHLQKESKDSLAVVGFTRCLLSDSLNSILYSGRGKSYMNLYKLELALKDLN